MHKRVLITILSMILSCFFLTGANSDSSVQEKNNTPDTVKKSAENIKVVFIELGSVRCIPCKKMQPVMAAIEKEYAGQVKVVFHDVWTDEGKPYAKKYKIKMIPTQVFLDADGKEYYRHVGFFPKDKIVEVLKKKGVK